MAVARLVDETIAGHALGVVPAGNFHAALDAADVRFLTVARSLGGMSGRDRTASDGAHPNEPGHGFAGRTSPLAGANRSWPGRCIDHVVVRGSEHGGPTLAVAACGLASRAGRRCSGDHFGVVADPAVPRQRG